MRDCNCVGLALAGYLESLGMLDLDLSKRSSGLAAPHRSKRLNFQSTLTDTDWEVIR
jgi:hypothetical protein